MRVKWLLVALDDLHQAGQYIAKSSPAAATKVIDRISKATRMLSDQPGIGRPGRVMGTRELVVTGTSYIIQSSRRCCADTPRFTFLQKMA
jgi:toxin ParE1/3/4